MSTPGRAGSPYKGLVPYSEEDAPFFFGRSAEREIIVANLMAARLTLLYGASGVGKSSVLRAGVEHHLRALARSEVERGGRPEFLPVVFNDWKDDPVAGLLECVRTAAQRVLGDGVSAPDLRGASLAEGLRAWTEHLGSDLLVVLDQFEECFLYHGHERGPGCFMEAFPAAVNRRDLRVSFLVSIREDAVAKLDRFKGVIPNLFDNYLRIEHLRREAARDAIEMPLARLNESREGERVEVEEGLVETVLDQLQTGMLEMGETGRGGIPVADGAGGDARIETPFLQLVMTRLWDEEARAGSRVLRLATLERLGGAGRIVRTHLDQVMDALSPVDQDAASQVFRYLVTPSGTKIALAPGDLSDFTGLPVERVQRVLEALSGGETRILRSDASRYEIFHDVLAAAILDWRLRFVERQRQAEVRRRAEERQAEVERQARRRGRQLVAGLAVMAIVAGGLAFAWNSSRKQNADLTKSNAGLAEDKVITEDSAYAEAAERLLVAPAQGTGDAVEVLPAAVVPLSLPAEAGDQVRRSGVVVRYFQPAALERSGVLGTLESLGFRTESAPGRFDEPPNSIAYGTRVSPSDVELLARTLLDAGFPVKRIRPFQAERGRSNVVEVVHSPALTSLPTLTAADVARLSAGPPRRAARP